jgi:hypothetical protein
LPAPLLFNLDRRNGWSLTEDELDAYVEEHPPPVHDEEGAEESGQPSNITNFPYEQPYYDYAPSASSSRGMRSKGSKVLTQVVVSEILIKVLLMVTTISITEVISRIAGHIDSSTIIIDRIMETIFVVMVRGLIIAMWPERIGILKMLSIRKSCQTLLSKVI